jgi:hypothetical protein
MSSGYDFLTYSQPDLKAVMREYYDKIIDFVTTDAFKELMLEMSALSPYERPKFVADVLINKDELKSRGVLVPDGILIQRSAFGDRRPTLFAVKHFLPDGYSDVWQNVNITFDNEYLDSNVSRDRETCWREPINPADQACLMAQGQALENA